MTISLPLTPDVHPWELALARSTEQAAAAAGGSETSVRAVYQDVLYRRAFLVDARSARRRREQGALPTGLAARVLPLSWVRALSWLRELSWVRTLTWVIAPVRVMPAIAGLRFVYVLTDTDEPMAGLRVVSSREWEAAGLLIGP